MEEESEDITASMEGPMRSALLVMLVLLIPGGIVAQEAEFPEGWQARLDRANADIADVRFAPMGTGYHVTLGPSTILFNPEHRASGSYRASATFTQTRATQHPEGFGLIIGGRDLDGPAQDYLYFLIRQDGQFTIRHRAGDEVHTIQEWTEHASIARVEGEGRATNTLAVEAAPQRARFLINGAEVAEFANVPHLNTEGIAGLRVNHNLDLHIEGFGVEP
jgi:hypothetical protein